MAISSTTAKTDKEVIDCIYDYCHDHFFYFGAYPVDIEIMDDEGEVLYRLELDEMLSLLSDNQKFCIENQAA